MCTAKYGLTISVSGSNPWQGPYNHLTNFELTLNLYTSDEILSVLGKSLENLTVTKASLGWDLLGLENAALEIDSSTDSSSD